MTPSDTARRPASEGAPGLRRAAKIAVGLAVVVVFGWQPARQLLQTSSVEAVVNAPLIAIRAPIDGRLASAGPASLSSGTALAAGSRFATIVNTRADRARLDDLLRHRQRLVDEKALLAERIAALRQAHHRAGEELQRYGHWRGLRLEARLEDLSVQVATAEHDLTPAEGALVRNEVLLQKRAASLPQVEEARRQVHKSRMTYDGLSAERRAVLIELKALHEGLFVGDSYNDRPATAQAADALAKEISELDAEAADRVRRLASADREIAAEEAIVAGRSEARIEAPGAGRVWEMLAMPGEEVKSGQELARLVDCGSAVVTATVTEQDFNRLFLGAPVRFRLQGETHELSGEIVHLSGIASAPANLAIAPSALVKEPYRVSVRVPALAVEGRCPVGRTGRVTFDLDKAPVAQVPSSPTPLSAVPDSPVAAFPSPSRS